MVDYRKILQLREQGASVNAIAHLLGCKWKTVDRVLSRCESVWGDIAEVPKNLSNEQIADNIFTNRYSVDQSFLQPDCEKILNRQRQGKSRNELWVEYVRQAKACGKNAYKITRFNELVSEYARSNQLSLPLNHQPGIEGQVDWVGEKAHIIDIDSKERVPIHILVISLPYSGYFYAEAFLDEKMHSWLAGHRNAFNFFEGCPSIIVPDNCRTAVTRARRGAEEAIINTQYAEFAEHYGMFVKPTRPRRPRDKAHVERTVQLVENDLLRPLSQIRCHSLAEFNRLLHAKMKTVLQRPYSKRTGSRFQIFMDEEQKMLLPLPLCEYQSYVEKKAVVSRDSHIQFDCAYYSVPVEHIKQTVIVRATETMVTIYTEKRTLIAEHYRALHKWQRRSKEEHFPGGNTGEKGYSRAGFIERAKAYGAEMVEWCNGALDRFEFEVQGYRTVVAVLSKLSSYHPDVVKEAAKIALSSSIFSTKGFNTIAGNLQAERLENLSSKQVQMNLNSLYCSHAQGEAE